MGVPGSVFTDYSQEHSLCFLCKVLLTHSHTITRFDKPFENTVEKGEIARNEQVLLFPQCFLPVWITICHFRLI